MRILMMTNTYKPIVGGLEKSIEAFSAGLRKLGHDVVIVAPEFEDMPKNEKDVFRVPAMKHVNGTDFSVNLPVPGLISEVAEKFKPDLIHAHHPFLVGDMGLRIAYQFGKPLVFTYHTMFEQYTHFLPIDNPASKKFIVELATGFANMSDIVIAPSESVRQMLFERGVQKPIEVIPTGVDPEKFDPENMPVTDLKLKIPRGAFVVGHIGRLSKEKNMTFLAKAVAAYLKTNPKAYFIIGGSGPSEKSIRKIFEKDEDLKSRVHFLGTLKGKALVSTYGLMHVFAFASKSETQGMVVTEAMAAGVPVVALDAPGVREVVRDGENGRLLPKQNVESFVEALEWVAKSDAAQKKILQQETRETAEEFSMEHSLERLVRVYNMVNYSKPVAEKGEVPMWEMTMKRVATELNMLMNLGKATGKAITEAILSKD